MPAEMSPREHDEKTAALFGQADQAERALAACRDRMHRLAGDRREYVGRCPLWKMTGAEVLRDLQDRSARGNERNLTVGMRPSEALQQEKELVTALAVIALKIRQMEQVYAASPWQRFFPCTNASGHIHASYRGCPSVRSDTQMAWRPDLSGLTVEQAVAQEGAWLCSICFPLAPVEWCQDRSEVTRAQREAAEAARVAAKAVKQLQEGEEFRDHLGSLVTTVAGCRRALRDEVELRDYYGTGRHPSHAVAAEAALRATQVLLAREAAQAGTGATQEEISRIIASAEKKNRKEGARI